MKIFLISLIYSLTFHPPLASAQDLKSQGWKTLKRVSGSDSILKRVAKGDVISVAKVESKKEKGQDYQELSVYGAGLHPKNCTFALRKLSLYENYSEYVGVISKSSYDDRTERVTFHIESSLLPFNMIMDFKIPRIKKPGVYPFTFDKGFVKGLRGHINVHQDKNKCLLMVRASFYGPDTGINDTILEFFTQALVKLALNNLIRISKTY